MNENEAVFGCLTATSFMARDGAKRLETEEARPCTQTGNNQDTLRLPAIGQESVNELTELEAHFDVSSRIRVDLR